MKSFLKFIFSFSILSLSLIYSQEKGVSEIKGNISVMCFDNFDGSQSYKKYYLNNSQGLFLLKENNNLKMDVNKGDHIVITNGLLSNNTILVDKNNIHKEITSISDTTKVKEINMLMVLATYINGDTTKLPTANEFKTKFLNSNSAIGGYLKEVSAGKVKFSNLDVVGWVSINRNFRNGVGVGDTSSLSPALTSDELNKIFKNYSINKSKYNYFSVIENYYNKDEGDLGYSFQGPYYDSEFGKMMRFCADQFYYQNDPFTPPDFFEVNDVKSPNNWTTFSRVFMHEMGHTFGFGHANTLINNDITQVNWYADYSDLMGGLSGHYSGYFKEIAGWLDSTNTLTISKSGNYTIKNFESINGTRFAKIQLVKNGNPVYLYLEYRNGTGFDYNPPAIPPFHVHFNQLHPYNTEGLFLKSTARFWKSNYDTTELYMINVHSIVDDGSSTETLNGSNIYSNNDWNIQVGPIVSRTDSTITFSVKFGQPTNVKITDIPYNYFLGQNYPNPFNPTTVINYSLPKSGFVTIKVYDVLGKVVTTLVNENKPVGNYKVEFNANKLTSGIYFYRMEAGNFIESKKLLLLK